MKFHIVDNIPIPEGKKAIHGILATIREAFNEMVPGESFLYDGRASDVYRAVPKMKVLTRKTEKGQIRVWLVSMKKGKKTYARTLHRNKRTAIDKVKVRKNMGGVSKVKSSARKNK